MPLGALIPLISAIAGPALGSLFGRPPAQQFQGGMDQVNALLQELTGRGAASRDTANALGSGYRGFYESQWPTPYFNDATDAMWRQRAGLGPLQQGTEGLGNFLGGMNQNTDYINQFGLPGTQDLQGAGQQYGTSAGSLLGTSGGYGVQQLLQQIMGGGLPNQRGMQNLFGPTSQMGLQGAQGALGLSNQIMQQGLPGQNIIQQLIGAGIGGGMQGLGSAQGFAQAGMGGLPGQSAISSLVNPLAQQGLASQGQAARQLQQTAQGGARPLTAIEQQSQNVLGGLIGGAGVSPEYVDAARRTILGPAREQMIGNISQMSGGQASLASPAYQEILRKQESDFADRMLMRGQENLGGYIGQGLGAGQQTVGQQLALSQALGNQGQGQISSALGAFGAVPQNQLPFAQLAAQTGSNLLGQGRGAFGDIPQNVFPFAQLSGNLGSNLLGQATQQFGAVPSAVAPFANMASNLGQGLAQQQAQNYNIGNSLGLNALQTIQNLRMQPYQSLQSQLGNIFSQNQNAGMGLLQSGQQFMGQQQNYDMDQLNQLGSIVRALLGAQQNETQMRYGTQASRGSAIGQGIANVIPGIASIVGRRGSSSGIDPRYPG